MKRLIVNADDLGYDPEIDRGILEAHARGIVTSTTAMVGTAFAERALKEAPPALGVGLHAVLDAALDEAAAERELYAQLDRFAALRGAPPTHLDSHKHVHARGPLLAAFIRVAKARGLPLRALGGAMRERIRGAGVRTADHFLGDAALRPCWTPARLAAALAALEEGTTEVMIHPGFTPSVAKTSFGREREVELAAACDPAVRAALERAGIELVGYGRL